MTASFNLHETIYYNLEQNSDVYAAFLDTYKAFDTVSHKWLFPKLEKIGLTGNIIRVILNAYTDITSTVVVSSLRSRWFPLKRGLRQGGTLPTFLYLVHINDLLNSL